MGIKKGDIVKVMVGKDRGKTGKILRVKDNRVWVQGVNMVQKHQKPTQAQKQGGIVKKESPVNISNVMYYDEEEGKAGRIGYRFKDDGKKVRYLKKTGELID